MNALIVGLTHGTPPRPGVTAAQTDAAAADGAAARAWKNVPVRVLSEYVPFAFVVAVPSLRSPVSSRRPRSRPWRLRVPSRPG